MKVEKMSDKGFSRRQFLTGAGGFAAGAVGMAAVTGGGLDLLRKAEAVGGPTEKWPWPYVKLSPEKTAEIAYTEWYRVYCGAAVISSVFSQLREKVGEPYTSFPVDAFLFLEGGISGWGTICGSNAGANIVTNLIIGPRIADSADGMLMGSEIMQWYSDTPLPVYTPNDPRVKTELPKTTSNSPLCHISVGKWMKAADKDLQSPERRDRCARVTASVAYHLVQLMNEWKDKKYITKGAIPARSYAINAQHDCTDCHGTNVPMPPKAAI
jgi:hypothetical protein